MGDPPVRPFLYGFIGAFLAALFLFLADRAYVTYQRANNGEAAYEYLVSQIAAQKGTQTPSRPSQPSPPVK